MEDKPLVSVIIPTFNSENHIEKCLQSLRNQTYDNIEIIVVDKNSNDKTVEIAKKYGVKIINADLERSGARNRGIKESKGDYILSIDSDMELTPPVIEECLDAIMNNENTGGIIIPERSVGDSFWAKVRDFERSFYDETEIESARFFKKELVEIVNGFDEEIIFFEEATLPQKIEKLGYNVKTRIENEILHHEENFILLKWLKKKYYYGKTALKYKIKYGEYESRQTSVIYRLSLFLKNKKFYSNFSFALGTIILKSLEYILAGLGYLVGRIER